jgi:hypothetical protein
MEKVLEGDTSKAWSKRYESKVRAGRLPPKRLAELCKIVFEAGTIRNVVVDRRKLDIAT